MSERRVETQLRAECSYCQQSQCVDSNNTNMVLHGYQRPGHGYTLGQCRGAYRPHFGTPEGRELAREWATEAAKEAARLTEIRPRVREEAAPWHEISRNLWQRSERMGYASHVVVAINRYTALDNAIDGDIRYYTRYAEDTFRRVAEWTAKAPQAVKIVRGKLTHWLRPGRNHTPACRFTVRYTMRSASYILTSNPAEVNCDKCKTRIERAQAVSA